MCVVCGCVYVCVCVCVCVSLYVCLCVSEAITGPMSQRGRQHHHPEACGLVLKHVPLTHISVKVKAARTLPPLTCCLVRVHCLVSMLRLVSVLCLGCMALCGWHSGLFCICFLLCLVSWLGTVSRLCMLARYLCLTVHI